MTVADELEQVDYVVRAVLERREAGVPLRQQAVLFRAAHHSDALEVELGRRNIPFVKFGGLRFLEAAHVKDAMACLRWAENPRDSLAAFRVAQLLPGMGPRLADGLVRHVATRSFALPPALASFEPPAAARERLAGLRRRFTSGCASGAPPGSRRWAWCGAGTSRTCSASTTTRACGSAIWSSSSSWRRRRPSRERFLSDLTLDPPQATGAEAGSPHLDEDYLVLSTIHSAKGQEWDSVFVLSIADGCIPSDLATGTPGEIEEERRLLYVAMTRAKNVLALVHPLRFYVRQQSRCGDRHLYTPRTRFIPDAILDRFARVTSDLASGAATTVGPRSPARASTWPRGCGRPGPRRADSRRGSWLGPSEPIPGSPAPVRRRGVVCGRFGPVRGFRGRFGRPTPAPSSLP